MGLSKDEEENEELLPPTYQRQRSRSTPPDFTINKYSPDSSSIESSTSVNNLDLQRDLDSYASNQLTLERMLNPGVFFNSLRETKKRKGALTQLGGANGLGLQTTLRISLQQV